jgi:hypothetical protein
MDERSCRLAQFQVLVVDDSCPVGRLVHTILAECGVRRVVEAADRPGVERIKELTGQLAA